MDGLQNSKKSESMPKTSVDISKLNGSLTQKPENLSKEQLDLYRNLTPLYQIWNPVKEDILSRKQTPEHTIGLKEIDDALWGLKKKELMVLGARTSHGKTSFAINMLKELAETSLRIIYFTLEMSKEHITEKLFSNFARVNNIDMRKGLSKDLVSSHSSGFEKWAENTKILIDDKNGYDWDNLVKVIDIIKPDFVFLDYIQMVSTKGQRSKVEGIENFVRHFKELCNTKNFGGILISQMNRSGVEDPGMDKLKWAGVLEEHSDVVILLFFDKEKKRYKVTINKQRNGVTGDFYIIFEPQYSYFRDMTEQESIDMEDEKKRKKSNRPDWIN